MQLVLFVYCRGRRHQRHWTVFRCFGLVFLPCLWSSSFLSKECAKRIVLIVNVVLILCLTFAKHNREISSKEICSKHVPVSAASTRTRWCPAEPDASPLQMDLLSLTLCLLPFIWCNYGVPHHLFCFFCKKPTSNVLGFFSKYKLNKYMQ